LSNNKASNNLLSIIDFDVVIIGGGVAGCAAAINLSKAGAKVALVEQQNSPRETVHSYLVAPGSLHELRNLGINVENPIGNTIGHTKVYLNGEDLIDGEFPEVEDMPRFAKVVPIKVLNQVLLDGARASGATVLEGWPAINFAVEKDWVTVIAGAKETTRTIRARLLIGADGVNSIVTRKLKGSAWTKTQRFIAARAQYDYVTVNPSQASLYFDDESFPGYGWIFPTSKSQASVGVGYILGANPPQKDPVTLLKSLIENNPAMQQHLKDARIVGEVEVLTSNLFDGKVPLVGDRLMVIGLAAGLVDPFNGEGLQMGLLSAKWAAETVQNCIANNNFIEVALTPYIKRIEGKFGYGFQLSETMFSLLRNRNLNRVWLAEFEAMCKRCKGDPEYKHTASAILSGMIFPNEEITAKMLMGTLQQTTLTAVTALGSILQNVTQGSPAPQTQNMFETATSVAEYAALNPLNVLGWGVEAAVQATGLAALVSTQALKNIAEIKQNTNQQ
jgi:geranylgeranyl reductase family protein